MKTLKDFFTKGGISSIEELVEKELSGIKEPFKTQKKQVISKLNDIFNGYFLDGFQNKLYGNFLSRALTAYVISNKFGLDYHEATKCITDDKLDYGIDAIYIENETIYIFQTKFSKSVDTNDLRSLKDGIAKLLNISFLIISLCNLLTPLIL